MSDILSQSEIDELLLALATGRDKPSETVEEPDQAQVKPYNFRTANKFSKEQIRMLTFIYENYAGRLSTFLSGSLRASCEVEVISIEEQTFSEFNNSLPSPAFLAIFEMPPLAGSSILELSTNIAYEIISRLFGGAGQIHDSSTKLFTEIEIAIITNIVYKMLNVMNESWERVTTLRTALTRTETSAQFAQIVDPTEPIVIITMNVKIGETSDLINFCIPHLAIQPIAKQLAMKAWYSDSGTIKSDKDTNIELNPRIANASLMLHAVFNATYATVKDVVSLQVGDVIRIEHPTNKELTVMVEHMPKFKGHLGLKGQRVAIKVTEIFKGVEEYE